MILLKVGQRKCSHISLGEATMAKLFSSQSLKKISTNLHEISPLTLVFAGLRPR